MSVHPGIERLNDYVDDELGAAERAAVDAHVAECAACRDDLASLRDVVNSAVTLPDEVAPARDLWPGVVAEYERRTRPDRRPAMSRARQTARLLWQVRLPLAAAATLALLVGSTGTWLLMRQSGDRAAAPAVAAAQPAAGAAQTAATGVVRVSFPGETDYRTAIGQLQAALDARADRLDPATVATVERNLRIIDDAIREARQALASDPANASLTHTLTDAYQSKLQLLRRAAQLPART